MPKKVGIVGGGITGLATALELVKKGYAVSVFEGEKIGGLASSFKTKKGEFLEETYHHMFKTDLELISLLEELGLKYEFRKATMGFYWNNKVFDFGTESSLLFFPGLNFIDKIRFGLCILYLRFENDWRKLEEIKAADWLRKVCGENVFNTIWLPLLRTKFGSKAEKVSMSWIWGRINLRAKSRGINKELLGYIDGSMQKLFEKLVSVLKEKGVEITKSKIMSIKRRNGKFFLDAFGGFDSIVFTVPFPIFLNITKSFRLDSYAKKILGVDYLGVQCMTFESEKPLSSIYWLNLGTNELPFGGIIEHTNFIPKERYGTHLFYLFNYCSWDDKIFNDSEQTVEKKYLDGLKKVFPEADLSSIKKINFFRNRFATPIYAVNHSKKIPPMETPVKGVFVSNTAYIYPFDRSLNYSIELAKKTAEKVGSFLEHC
ncbi:MAG: FAD-dependent oxidoreductase [Candidatus Diapherotrites archaeon]|uniref:FAD-dependent oxidoreductase n=1 Tax=Candidatus Iainarchaeum sp. TaxID=3101447 RepID=A0A7J4IV07_9ARCH|nr:MAG: hypothetical protein QT03_C0001G0643 [archaeon GW2011_AR10]MBS3058949.1 FAD-dependent oxidoreductase [Candidatus Diapherotrites archaeon]HIH08624.1 FAD-dependent oxidoreductase [Candidatus Diapherotrites archaeon]